jgi:hypothetical protein
MSKIAKLLVLVTIIAWCTGFPTLLFGDDVTAVGLLLTGCVFGLASVIRLWYDNNAELEKEVSRLNHELLSTELHATSMKGMYNELRTRYFKETETLKEQISGFKEEVDKAHREAVQQKMSIKRLQEISDKYGALKDKVEEYKKMHGTEAAEVEEYWKGRYNKMYDSCLQEISEIKGLRAAEVRELKVQLKSARAMTQSKIKISPETIERVRRDAQDFYM